MKINILFWATIKISRLSFTISPTVFYKEIESVYISKWLMDNLICWKFSIIRSPRDLRQLKTQLHENQLFSFQSNWTILPGLRKVSNYPEPEGMNYWKEWKCFVRHLALYFAVTLMYLKPDICHRSQGSRISINHRLNCSATVGTLVIPGGLIIYVQEGLSRPLFHQATNIMPKKDEKNFQ